MKNKLWLLYNHWFENLLLNEGIISLFKKKWNVHALWKADGIYTCIYILVRQFSSWWIWHSHCPDKDVIWGLLVWFILYNFCAINLTEYETINNATAKCLPDLQHQIHVKVYFYKRNKTTAIIRSVSFIVM